MYEMSCIFCKIVSRELPAHIVYENEHVCAFKDINPVAPVHVVIITKKHIERVDSTGAEDVAGHIVRAVAVLASDLGLSEDGYRVVVNAGSFGGQTVNHLHFHLLGGRRLQWPPG